MTAPLPADDELDIGVCGRHSRPKVHEDSMRAAWEVYFAALPAAIQQNIQDGMEHGKSWTRDAFFAGWNAAMAQARPYDLRA